MFKRFWAVFHARNLEFFRDRSSLSWNVAFPVLMLVGFSVIFSGEGRSQFKVGLVKVESVAEKASGFFNFKHIEFVTYTSLEKGKLKLQQHALDLLIDPLDRRYWVNTSSPKGYLVEKLLIGHHPGYLRETLAGREIRYLDWVVPGILGMNMMFSCLFGVGYVIVRYRKSAVLKRLSATPLNAFEFLLAQVLSRLFIVVAITSSIFVACNWMFDFYMLGSYPLLLLVCVLGAMSMIALGLLMASRSHSEELAGGLLNLVSWPMMILSGVWFSLEGAPELVQQAAYLLPLTHMLDAARAIMTEGASVAAIADHLMVLAGMTGLFLFAGALLFRWQGEGR